MQKTLGWLLLLLFSIPSFALTYSIPSQDDTVVGNLKIIPSKSGESLQTIARTYEIGFDAIVLANPKVKKYGFLKPNTPILIPSFFVLPNTPRDGIVINLPEKRLYYYLDNGHSVLTEPVTIGKEGWKTPPLKAKISRKEEDPVWRVPISIQQEQIAAGINPPKTFVPPGPDNPLGKFALRVGQSSILLHGTNNPYSIGKRASHGCIRLYPEDIEALFNQVDTGTPVRIADQPYKTGFYEGRLYLEVHPALAESRGSVQERVKQIYDLIMQTVHQQKERVNWTSVKIAIKRENGIPALIDQGE